MHINRKLKEWLRVIIGVLKEIKPQESRVALTPSGVDSLVKKGHTVLFETGASHGIDLGDEEYAKYGAKIMSAKDIWEKSELILKVKEPVESEYQYLRDGQIIFTYLHLASNEKLAKILLDKGVVAFGYETVNENGTLPCLTPMSEVAGRMAIQEGSTYLNNTKGGKGILLEGVPGVPPGNIVIVGAGHAGASAIKRAIGIGARVTVLDINIQRLKYLEEVYGSAIATVYSNEYNLKKEIKNADLVVGSVLIPGSKAPKLITEEMLESMEEGSVVVDIAIDQGGCVENVHPTSYADPVYKVHGVSIFAVENIPGAVPKTSTYALTNATHKYIELLAYKGWKGVCMENEAMKYGLNVAKGKVTFKGVSDAFGMEYKSVDEIIKG